MIPLPISAFFPASEQFHLFLCLVVRMASSAYSDGTELISWSHSAYETSPCILVMIAETFLDRQSEPSAVAHLGSLPGFIAPHTAQ